jgi:hypothetical protein
MIELAALKKKTINVIAIGKRAAVDEDVLGLLLHGISPEAKAHTVRENSFKALMWLSEKRPDILFAHWRYLVGVLQSGNSFSKYAAIHIIASLVPADTEGRFEKAFSTFYACLGDKSVMVASHIAGTSGRIGAAKPELQARITKRLLNIDKIHPSTEQRELVKANAIEALSEYFEESRDRRKILAFVRRQLESKSPRTRKAAKAFLTRWEDPH